MTEISSRFSMNENIYKLIFEIVKLDNDFLCSFTYHAHLSSEFILYL